MSPLTTEQLAARLFEAAGTLRGTTDASEIVRIVGAMLFLKRAADQPGLCEVRNDDPLRTIMRASNPDQAFGGILKELEQDNPLILDGVFTSLTSGLNLRLVKIARLAAVFDGISLSDANLEFPDSVGDAYERLLANMADTSGKRGGEMFTPAAVADLMIRIASPNAGDFICDPFTGVGGFLTAAHKYIQEATGDSNNISVFGQEINSSTWVIAKINLLLHNNSSDNLRTGDTLAEPAHTADGSLMKFDRVLTHAPFSMNYDKQNIHYREQMRYGFPSEHGRADLVIIQHVLATLAPGGLGAVLAPLGVLFRSGAEADIRRRMLDDGRIDTVIGLGPNILPNTGIPACILVLRGPGKSRSERLGDVLFINAELGLIRSRGTNRLGPETIEKIVTIFRNRADLPGFSRAVSVAEIEGNDLNLSVRPYTDRTLPSEPPTDAAAIISGGVPHAELAATADRFRAFGIEPETLFMPRIQNRFLTETYSHLHFYPEGYEATAKSIGDLVHVREGEFTVRCKAWWERTRGRFAELARERQLLSSRPQLIDSFANELLLDGLLDEYQLRGVFAAWWSAWHDDLRVLEHYGSQAVVDRWLASDAARARTVRGDPDDGVLDLLGGDLVARAQALVVAERQNLVDIYLSWGERYGTSLLQLEAEAQEARGRLEDRLRELGYVDPWGSLRPCPDSRCPPLKSYFQ